MSQRIQDHDGNDAEHGRAMVNGVSLHYVKAGSGEPLVLLHGVPKTSYYWRKVMPLLTPRYTVLAPDLRGFGDSGHPTAGYDARTMAEDVAQLAGSLGFERFRLVGEDWGAVFAYTLAASYPERVQELVYQEMLLPGFGLEEWSYLTPENARSGNWLWHISFYSVPHYPEALISGRERQYFSPFIKDEAYDPAAIPEDAIDEYVRCYSIPGALRSMCEVYCATLQDAGQIREIAGQRLSMPVLAVGSKYFIGKAVHNQMERVAADVRYVELDYGHQLAEECPKELAREYLGFFGE